MRAQDQLIAEPKPRRIGKKRAKPLGILTVLGGLFLVGYLSQTTGPERAPWVWKDFKKTQGIYLGYYFQKGHRYLSLMTDKGITAILVDKTVTAKFPMKVGARVEVTYNSSDPTRPKIVRGEDIRSVYIPDPVSPGRATRYW